MLLLSTNLMQHCRKVLDKHWPLDVDLVMSPFSSVEKYFKRFWWDSLHIEIVSGNGHHHEDLNGIDETGFFYGLWVAYVACSYFHHRHSKFHVNRSLQSHAIVFLL